MLQRDDLAEFHKHFDKTVQKTFDEHQEMLDNYPMLDENGYPTDHCIQIIKNWRWSDPWGWFNFIKEYWWASDLGWKETDEPCEYKKGRNVHRYYLSTCGWTGNEALIHAMKQNWAMWSVSVHWVQSRRDGHYIFEIENTNN